MPGRDLRYTLELSFEEAALGVEKTIKFPAPVECGTCKGTGAKGGEAGHAHVRHLRRQGRDQGAAGLLLAVEEVPDLRRQRQGRRRRAATCARAPAPSRRSASSPSRSRADAEDGATRRVAGQGEPGKRGGAPGDLNVIVRVRPHPIFKRESGVVTCEVPVSIVEATLGAVIKVPTLDGAVDMRVPAGTQSGTLFRLRGKGAGKPRRARRRARPPGRRDADRRSTPSSANCSNN